MNSVNDKDALEKEILKPEVRELLQNMPKKAKDKEIEENRLIMLMVLREHIINSIFWNLIIDMIESEIKRRGFRFRIYVTDENDFPLAGMVDGFILLGTISLDHVNMVINTGKPFVCVDGESKYDGNNHVRMNNLYGAYRITEKVIELGHRRLAFIKSSFHLSYYERYRGMADCVYDHKNEGVTCELIEVGQDHEEEKLIRMITQECPPTFILTCTDVLAHTIYMIAEQRNILIPGDISLAGFDNLHESRLLIPPLSSVDVPRLDMAIASIELLIKQMNNPLSSHELIQVQPTIVLRKSIAPPREALF